MKPKVYVETSVIGYLASWPSRDIVVAGHQQATHYWWRTAKDKFELIVSQLVMHEASAGDKQAADERLALMEGLEVLTISQLAENLANELMVRHAVPASEPEDALHIALAASHGVQYLATWNFRHIANVMTRERIDDVCQAAGFTPPLICTPEELTPPPQIVEI